MERVRYVYKTTCIVTNKYYIGMHSTTRPNVKYYGSGVHIKRSLAKYGKDNHVVEILEYAETDDDLRRRECEIVDDVMLSDELCMNLMVGGRGGFTDEQRTASRNAMRVKLDQDPEYSARISEMNRTRASQVTQQGRQNCSSALRLKYSDPEFKETQRMHAANANIKSWEARREKVRQGWCWLTDPQNNKRRKLVPPEDIEHLTQLGWRVGRC